jgi:TonB-linked SusC/RagA family outer membrane protein
MKKKLWIAGILIFAIAISMNAQQRTITGLATSIDGTSLPGVNVLVKGTSIGTITNAEGKYSITVPPDAKTLVFSFVGMEKQEIPIGNSSVINVSMEISTAALNEVVVTAFGIERKTKALGFSAQEVKQEDLADAREISVINNLKGKIAGVQVSSTSSGSGGSSVVTIRGNSSITGNNQPLYVVDGIPITNRGHSSGGLWGDQDYGDGIGGINPEDVESMTVLKGPNASALYGSRGANGVILITTKSGKGKKSLGVELNVNVLFDVLNLTPTFQNKYATGYEGTNIYGSMVEIPSGSGQYYETMDTWHGDSWGPPLDGRRTIVDPFVYPEDKNSRTLVLLPQDPNNVRDFWETGIIQNTTVAFTGGTEKSNARLSIGNTYTKGITPKHRVNRQTVDIRTNTQLTDKLSFDVKINYIHTKGEQRPALGSSSDNIVRNFATMGRYVPLDWLKEYYETTGSWGRWPGISYNPYYIINELKNNDSKDRIIGYVSLKYQFTNWLSLMGRAGTDFYSETRNKTWPVGARGGSNSKGRLTQQKYNVSENNYDALLTANGNLTSNITGSFSLGAALLQQKYERQGWDGRNFKAEGVYSISNCQDFYPSYSLSQKEMQSVYFMGQLGFKNFLFLDITGRNDWSSALGKDNYSFFYPSISTSFVFTDAFSISSNVLTFGKIRASWAQVGNDSDPYLTQSGYNSYTTSFNGQSYASMSNQIPLFDLKNELTSSWEIGGDLRLFENRLGLDLTYYNGKTTNQILPVTISNASGYSRVVINAGEIQNSGLEIVLNVNPIKTSSGFRWDLAFNYAKNNSKVIELAPGIETYRIASNYPNNIEARPGEAYGNIIGYAFKKSPDGRRIVGPGGSYQRESELSILGNITPNWIGGLNNTFSFKGLSMNILIDFVQGGQLSSSTKYQMTAKGSGLFTEEGRRPRDTDDQGNQLPYVGVLDGVVEIFDAEGNVTGYEENTKAVDGQTYWASRAWGGPTEEFVLDASYIMLREVLLSYEFRLKTSSLTAIRLSLVGRNLLYLEEHMQNMGISPESAPNTSAGYNGIESLSMPTTRTYGLNVKFTF